MNNRPKLASVIEFNNQCFKIGDTVGIHFNIDDIPKCPYIEGKIIKFTFPTRQVNFMGKYISDDSIVTLDMSDKYESKIQDFEIKDINEIHKIE